MAVDIGKFIQERYPTLSPTLKELLGSFFKRFYREDEINTFLQKHRYKDALSFCEAIVEYFDVQIILNKKETQRIPSYGKAILVANHPLGALDAIALLSVIKEVRRDVKVVASSFLQIFENLQDILIPVDNFNGKIPKSSLQKIYEALNNQELILIFPAGEVSRAKPTGIKDGKWQTSFYKIAKKTQAPIVPVFIEATNSKTFYLVSSINKALATALLPREMFKFENKTIKFKIGKQIPYSSYNLGLKEDKEVVKLLRRHLFRIAKGKKGIFQTQNEIAHAENPALVKKELKNAQLLGATNDGKKIYLYRCDEENALIKEIGRLREISFREVGEGTGKKRDIDEYDYLYDHIVLWDEEELEIVGAYRIANVGQIVEDFGIDMLYSSSLFHFDKNFYPYFSSSIELGRSFVQPKYWNSRALDLLWQGIGAYLKANPRIRYLFGPVSISNSYTKEAKDLLIFYYMFYYGAKEPLVTHKTPYTISEHDIKRFEKLFTLKDKKKDLLILKRHLEQLGFSIPTLYKKYTNAYEDGGVQFFDFGIDKDFGDCVDGFLFVDTHKLKPSMKKRYIDSVGYETNQL